jgi:hypothetical protein
MPPEDYATIIITDGLAAKLTRIMAHSIIAPAAGAIEYTTDTVLIQGDEITIRELVQLLDKRVDKVDEGVLQ